VTSVANYYAFHISTMVTDPVENLQGLSNDHISVRLSSTAECSVLCPLSFFPICFLSFVHLAAVSVAEVGAV
jgi:hypothetical protein